MRFFTVAAFAALLSGCAATRAELAAADDEKCQSYGAQPATPAYVQCRTQLDVTRTTARAIIAASPAETGPVLTAPQMTPPPPMQPIGRR
jgi:hypothetical protein